MRKDETVYEAVYYLESALEPKYMLWLASTATIASSKSPSRI